ncbi:MAG TPA: hypothetical protein VGL48_00650 [Acidimicrobiales bacterium]|jgi:hypothetical protein
MERFVFEAIDVDRPRLFGRYNPLRIRGWIYEYQGPRGPVEITISDDGLTASFMGPEISAVDVPCGVYAWDDEDDPLRDGVVVAIGHDQVTFSLPQTRGLPVVEATTGWATWRAYRTSASLFRWNMVDAQTGRHFAEARAWKGKVRDSSEACGVGAMIIIWAAFLDRLFALGPSLEAGIPPVGPS